MADGYAQATRRPTLVNLHTAAGAGNALNILMTDFQNKTPLLVTAGQQTREMLPLEPWLTNVEPTMLPRAVNRQKTARTLLPRVAFW